MNSGEKKMKKEEMKHIHAGNEKSGNVQGSNTPGKHPGSTCAFAAGTCCRRTDNCPPNANR